MLKTLTLKNFTAFKHAAFSFAPNLNVIVGENGTGKTHLLKLAYSVLYVCGKENRASSEDDQGNLASHKLIQKFLGVFRVDSLQRLGRRESRPGRCHVKCLFDFSRQPLEFSFNGSPLGVKIDEKPSERVDKLPVYLPTRELLTIYPGFVSLYETSHLPFEETWRDTCILLGAPLAKGLREKRIKELLIPLEEAMGGKVESDEAGRFYLNHDGDLMEMHLVAEGLRKLAMVARLIMTGALVEKAHLFWDEPESNLNPKVIKLVARTILSLCKNGIQVFIASHSLFLLRELDILLNYEEFKKLKAQFIGLHQGEEGVEVQQGETIDDIGPIDALQEELSQSDRYLSADAQ